MAAPVTELTGIVATVILGATPAAIALSILLMWLYRRSVLAEMQRRSLSRNETRLTTVHPPASRAVALPTLARLRASRFAGLRKYGFAGIAYACVATVTWFCIAGLEFYPGRTLTTITVFFWPFLVVLDFFFSERRRDSVLLVISYITVLLVLGLLFAENWYDPSLLWAALNGPATLLVLGFLWHRVRAVGPLSLAFALFVLLGASLGMAWLARSVATVSQAAAAVGATAEMVLTGTLLAGTLPAGALGFVLLRVFGRLYRTKRLSEQELFAGAIIFTFALFLCIHLTFSGKDSGYFALGFPAFLGYCLAVRCLRPRLVQTGLRAPRLLLLRVFGTPAVASKLWRAIGSGWRYVGTVCMIGGPDLAASAIEPHRFLDFIGRKLKDRFLRDAAGLERALSELDEQPDADGKYPVTELYCWDDMWPSAFKAVADRCDAILLDLRGFDENRRGAAFELTELAKRGALSRSVLLIDDSTNESLISRVISVAAPEPTFEHRLRVSGARIPIVALTQLLFEVARVHIETRDQTIADGRRQPSTPLGCSTAPADVQ